MKIITIDTLKKRMTDVLLIDVREHFERSCGYIEGDIHIPLGELTLNRLPNIDKPIVFYCRSGMRSISACQKVLKDLPSLDVSSLHGGFIAWQEHPIKQ